MIGEIFSKNLNIDDLDTSLITFCSRSNLNLHNIPVTLKMFKKVITNLDFSEDSDSDYIKLLFLKNLNPNFHRFD